MHIAGGYERKAKRTDSMGTKQRQIEMLVGGFVLLCLIGAGYLTVNLGDFQLFSPSGISYKARFSEVGGLVEGSEVRISGVQVGRVNDISLDRERFAVMVTFSLNNEDIRLSEGTMVSIKTRGLIGDKYLSVSPGGTGMYLEPGETIIDTQPPVDIHDLIGKYAFGSAGGED